jgi:hypothetical protein
MTPTKTAPDPAVFPEEVRRFAAERGVTQYLVPLNELAKRCFDGADVAVTFQSDYEIPDLHWIVYEVASGSWMPDRWQAAHARWRHEKLRTLPPPGCGAFVLRAR